MDFLSKVAVKLTEAMITDAVKQNEEICKQYKETQKAREVERVKKSTKKSDKGYVRVIPRPRNPLLDEIDIITYARRKPNGPDNVRIVDPSNNTGIIKFNRILNTELLPIIYDVNVSGIEYQIIFMSEEGFNCMQEAEGSAGLCDTDFKKIYVHIMDGSKIPDIRKIQRLKTTLRHELTHAFIYESGLDIHTDPLFQEGWAINEEAIDWYAHKIPHMSKTFEELGILE